MLRQGAGLATLVLGLLISPLVVEGSGSKNKPMGYFKRFGIGFSTGMTALEEALPWDYEFSFGLGGELDVEILGTEKNHLLLQAAYWEILKDKSKGSQFIRIRTKYRTVEAGLGYEYRKLFFGFGVRGGVSFYFLKIKTDVFSLGEPEEDLGDPFDETDNQYFFPDKKLNAKYRDTGVNYGGYTSVYVSLDFANLVGAQDSLLDIRFQGGYSRRGVRNDFGIALSVVFWPSELIKRNKNK